MSLVVCLVKHRSLNISNGIFRARSRQPPYSTTTERRGRFERLQPRLLTPTSGRHSSFNPVPPERRRTFLGGMFREEAVLVRPHSVRQDLERACRRRSRRQCLSPPY